MAARRRLGAALCAAAPAALAIGCLTLGDDLAAGVSRIPAGVTVVLVALHLATLVLRSEAWRLTLGAVEGRPMARRAVHAADAGAFVAGALQAHAALPVRVTLLRRFAGERAPRAAQVAIADLPLLLLEACAAAAVLGAGAVAAGGAGLWLALCVTTAACGALLAARTSLARLAPGPRRAGWQCSGTSRAGRRSRRWWWRSPRSAWRACGSCSTRSGCPQTPVTLRSSSRAWACSGCCRSDHPPRRAQPWRPPTAPGSARPWRPDWP